MSVFKNLKGQKFGKLTVVKYAGTDKQRKSLWQCKCECGNYITTRGTSLRFGSPRSCGCLQKQVVAELKTKHGFSRNRLYRIWKNMKQRCYNPKAQKFENYGGRGVRVCKEWNNYENFHSWAMENGYEEGLTLDRINNDGDYEPNNCRWVTYSEQSLNSRTNHLMTYKGETKTLKEWAEIFGMNYSTLSARINDYFWDIKTALETPIRERRDKSETKKFEVK